MKTLALTALLFTTLPLHAEAAVSRTGQLVVERCQDSGSPFREDQCVKEKKADGGQCSVASDGRTLRFRSSAWSGSAGIDRPYQFGPDESRHNLNLRGLVRGSVILESDHVTPKEVRIYKNLDRTGKVYLRYDCRNLHGAKARKASAENIMPPMHAVLKAFASPNEAKACDPGISI